MINQFLFDGIYSYSDCGLYIEKRPSPIVPQRDITKTHVPGRSGDVILDNGCYLNVTQTYRVGCSDIDGKLSKIKEMLSKTGYRKLFDTYNSDFFRYAAVINAISFEEDLLNVGHANIEFDCEPYRYQTAGLLSKKISVSETNMTNLNNPFMCDALPSIYIQAQAEKTCTIMINSDSFSFTMPEGNTKVYIDSLSESCYFNENNLNNGFNSDVWPSLSSGINSICVIGATSAQICPRWRTI